MKITSKKENFSQKYNFKKINKKNKNFKNLKLFFQFLPPVQRRLFQAGCSERSGGEQEVHGSSPCQTCGSLEICRVAGLKIQKFYN